VYVRDDTMTRAGRSLARRENTAARDDDNRGRRKDATYASGVEPS
jgi:hypothetical protein